MSLSLDLSGKRFGRLVAIRSRILDGQTYWLCECDCGKMKLIQIGHLTSGHTKSCGCLKSELLYKHGHGSHVKRSSTYRTYHAMIGRCEDPNDKEYRRYRGRGIRVCKRWRKDFRNFLADMGERLPGTEIHRKNSNGDYKPSNCCWMDKSAHSSLHLKEMSLKQKGR